LAFIPADARWYLAWIVLEHIVEGDSRNVVHINMHLIESRSPEEAHKKATALGRASQRSYSNTDGREVRVVFRGLRDLNVVHEEFQDGAELSYTEAVAVPEKQLRGLVTPKRKLSVFRPIESKREPNYFPESVMQELEKKGFKRSQILPRRRRG
jgi:hypothetical protein